MRDCLEGIFNRFEFLDLEHRKIDGWRTFYIPTLAWMICTIKAYYVNAYERTPAADDTDDAISAGEDEANFDGITDTDTSAPSMLVRPSRQLFDRQLKSIIDEWSPEDLAGKVRRLEGSTKPASLLPPLQKYFVRRSKNGMLILV